MKKGKRARLVKMWLFDLRLDRESKLEAKSSI